MSSSHLSPVDTIQQRTPVIESHFRNAYRGMQKPLYLQLQRKKGRNNEWGEGETQSAMHNSLPCPENEWMNEWNQAGYCNAKHDIQSLVLKNAETIG